MTHDLRRWITLCESETHDFYVHVSPIKNLRAILAKGLVPNVEGGNYSGSETSLSGTYVTKEPRLIHDHIRARDMQDGFILVLVQVPNTEGVIDEDALQPWLVQCTEDALRPLGLDVASASSKYDPDDDIWKSIAPCFVTRLGQPDEAVLRQNPDLVEEFINTMIHCEIYGEDEGDPDWWQSAKEQLIMAFPQLSHPDYGNRYSIRLPAVGYTGPSTFGLGTHIVAVITMRRGEYKVVKGEVPWAARALIDACLDQ
jgi:hypothetical protein